MHFYCEHDALFKETLQQLDFISEINVQDDPNWDTYFDFLLVSPLGNEIKCDRRDFEYAEAKGAI